MKIRRPLSLSGLQIGFATLLGVFGGVYIWKPALILHKHETGENAVKKKNY